MRSIITNLYDDPAMNAIISNLYDENIKKPKIDEKKTTHEKYKNIEGGAMVRVIVVVVVMVSE